MPVTWESVAAGLPPIQPGLFEGPERDGTVHLLGARCRACGTRAFPVRARCVACYGSDLETVRLETRGTVDTFTVIRQAPPGYGGPVPYVLGMVVLGNDVHVLAHLAGKPVDAWRPGEAVVTRPLVLPVGGSGREVMAFAFHPASEDVR